MGKKQTRSKSKLYRNLEQLWGVTSEAEWLNGSKSKFILCLPT
jgi:hypothetical protein